MTISEAIQKSIEGGWNDRLYRTEHYSKDRKDWTHHSSLFLDPSFWQCLGKAMGWISDDPYFCRCPITGEKAKRNPAFLADCLCHREFARDEWKTEWHKFIDHLAEGKTASDFFASLT